MKKVLITGTGTVAKHLAIHLDKLGYRVNFLSTSRSYFNKFPCFFWDVKNKKINPTALQDVFAIIHLAGAGIADKKWTSERKIELESSRIESADLLYDTIKNNPTFKPEVFISASGSNYYGTVTSKETFTEEYPAGNDYLGALCVNWENAAHQFENLDLRTVVLRTGIVLSTKGGALPKLSELVKLYLGAPVGSGKQIMPWIHIDDLCAMYAYVLKNANCNGAYNAVSSEKVCNRYFMRSLGKILQRPIFPIGIPAFLLKIRFGELASILLKGSFLSNQKIVDEGFCFEHPRLFDALEDVIEQNK